MCVFLVFRFNQLLWTRCSTSVRRPCSATIKPFCWWRACHESSQSKMTLTALKNVCRHLTNQYAFDHSANLDLNLCFSHAFIIYFKSFQVRSALSAVFQPCRHKGIPLPSMQTVHSTHKHFDPVQEKWPQEYRMLSNYIVCNCVSTPQEWIFLLCFLITYCGNNFSLCFFFVCFFFFFLLAVRWGVCLYRTAFFNPGPLCGLPCMF